MHLVVCDFDQYEAESLIEAFAVHVERLVEDQVLVDETIFKRLGQWTPRAAAVRTTALDLGWRWRAGLPTSTAAT